MNGALRRMQKRRYAYSVWAIKGHTLAKVGETGLCHQIFLDVRNNGSGGW